MIEPIPYTEDASKLFAFIAHEAWSVWLDSCYPYINTERFDIMAFRPKITLQSYETFSVINDANFGSTTVTDHPFVVLTELLKKHAIHNSAIPAIFPFRGGAIGYFSYDLARTLEQLPTMATNDCPIPLLQVGIYDTFIIIDHFEKSAWFISDSEKTFFEQVQFTSSRVNPSSFKLTTHFKSNFSKARYASAFAKVMNYIYEGDCYQINLSQRFEAEFSGSLFSAYQYLRGISPTPYAAYLNFPETSILSFSPEHFIEAKSNHISTSPIKGTRPRNSDPIIDATNKAALQNSDKDKAENLMIVDLLRNDFGRVCDYGTVKVNKLFSLESFANVHHLVSTIVGHLRQEHSSIDLLTACFPGGSITGTPKIRAMEIIEELEPNRRNIYCGSLGFINYDGDMNLNIAIRTLYTFKNKIYCAAGGAIVADSQLEAEYQETLDKVDILLKALLKRFGRR